MVIWYGSSKNAICRVSEKSELSIKRSDLLVIANQLFCEANDFIASLLLGTNVGIQFYLILTRYYRKRKPFLLSILNEQHRCIVKKT